MSTTPDPVPATPQTPANVTPPVAPAATAKGRGYRLLVVSAVLATAVLCILGVRFLCFRLSHSITEDAFVESHMVNVSPQLVSGRLIRYLADENEHVEQGQVLAEIDPVPYRDQVELARTKVEAAKTELQRQEAALARMRIEVPLHIDVAERSLIAATSELAKAKLALKLTVDEVTEQIEQTKAGVEAASADAVLAGQEYDRFTSLYNDSAVSQRRSQEVTRARDSAVAGKKAAESKHAMAESSRLKIHVATHNAEEAETAQKKAESSLSLAQTGNAQIHEIEILTELKRINVQETQRALDSAEDQLRYTQIRAPFPGVVVRRFRNLGDFASAGVPILSMYNPDFLYVTANLEETRLIGVAPGNAVQLEIDAFAHPFTGRVVWINKSTGAQFALMPRNVVSGEFTKVVQRVPLRILIEKDERWPSLRAGLSVRVTIAHGSGDSDWADKAAREMKELESRFNQPRH